MVLQCYSDILYHFCRLHGDVNRFKEHLDKALFGKRKIDLSPEDRCLGFTKRLIYSISWKSPFKVKHICLLWASSKRLSCWLQILGVQSTPLNESLYLVSLLSNPAWHLIYNVYSYDMTGVILLMLSKNTLRGIDYTTKGCQRTYLGQQIKM